METIKIELQGAEWVLQIKPWPYKKGRRWLTRFVKILGGVALKVGNDASDDVGINELLEKLDEDMLEELLDECEGQTVCVGPNKKGVPFEKIEPLLRTRYDVTVRLTAAHLRVNFGPFFASLGSVLADLTGEAPVREDGEAAGT